ncbi:hypothetical protein AgCh_007068 [Apium graveolens]
MAYTRDLEAELPVLQEENASLQQALFPRPYNASEEESLFVFPREVRIEGLKTLDYLDNLFDRKCFTEQGDTVTFESEVDRAYLSTEDCIHMKV